MATEYDTNLSSLRISTSSDLAALAFVDKANRLIYWKYSSGNQNKRFTKMVAKPGVDLSGMVVRFGDIIVIDETVDNIIEKRLDFPIMLAEKLYSALAAPVLINGKIKAVLLIGNRTKRTYTHDEKQLVQKWSKNIASIIEGNTNVVYE